MHPSNTVVKSELLFSSWRSHLTSACRLSWEM